MPETVSVEPQVLKNVDDRCIVLRDGMIPGVIFL